jgi:(2Fe-2S) ferredoxin
MFSAVWAGLERDQLAYYKTGGSVRCTATGCLGACSEGPTVAAYSRDGSAQWWVEMTAEATIELAADLHRKHTSPKEQAT